jgi:hypothetical protein
MVEFEGTIIRVVLTRLSIVSIVHGRDLETIAPVHLPKRA